MLNKMKRKKESVLTREAERWVGMGERITMLLL